MVTLFEGCSGLFWDAGGEAHALVVERNQVYSVGGADNVIQSVLSWVSPKGIYLDFYVVRKNPGDSIVKYPLIGIALQHE